MSKFRCLSDADIEVDVRASTIGESNWIGGSLALPIRGCEQVCTSP
jgi:hypothetical protein